MNKNLKSLIILVGTIKEKKITQTVKVTYNENLSLQCILIFWQKSSSNFIERKWEL